MQVNVTADDLKVLSAILTLQERGVKNPASKQIMPLAKLPVWHVDGIIVSLEQKRIIE